MGVSFFSQSSPRLRGTFYCVLSGALFGLMGIFVSGLYEQHFTVFAVLFWRFFIAALWLAATRQVIRLRFYGVLNSHLAFFRAVLLTVISYSFNTLFYFLAAKSIGTGIAMVIFFTFPAIVTFYAWYSGSWTLNAYGIAAMVAVLMGMVLLEGMGAHALNVRGVLCALVAAFFYASYIIVSRKQIHLADSLTLALFTCLGNSIFFLVASFYQHVFIFPQTLSAWLDVLGFGVLCTALPIQLLLNGVRCIGPAKASMLSVTEPIVMVIVGVLCLHENITVLQGIGVVTMLLGAILIQFEKPSGEIEPVLV